MSKIYTKYIEIIKIDTFFDVMGLYSLLFTVMTIPLSIFLTEVFFVFYLITFFIRKRYVFIHFDSTNMFIIMAILYEIVSLMLHLTNHAIFDFKQSLYLLIIPFISSNNWNENRYILLLRFFIYGMVINLGFGIVEAFGIPVINTNGQGNLGLINFHIYSSMLISMSMLLLLYDFFYQRLIPVLILRFLFFIAFAWQLFTSDGRTGQALLFILMPLIIVWNFRYFKQLVVPLLLFFVSLTYFFSTKAIHLWKTGFTQLSVLISGGDHTTDMGLRYLFIKAGFMMFMSHPLFGVGIGQFRKTFYVLVGNNSLPKIPDYLYGFVGPTNSYIAIISELGFLGVIIYFALFASFYKKIAKIKQNYVRRIHVLFFLWFLIGCVSDVIIWREVVVVPFLIFISAASGVINEK